jgi:hypothetical protein
MNAEKVVIPFPLEMSFLVVDRCLDASWDHIPIFSPEDDQDIFLVLKLIHIPVFSNVVWVQFVRFPYVDIVRDVKQFAIFQLVSGGAAQFLPQ